MLFLAISSTCMFSSTTDRVTSPQAADHSPFSKLLPMHLLDTSRHLKLPKTKSLPSPKTCFSCSQSEWLQLHTPAENLEVFIIPLLPHTSPHHLHLVSRSLQFHLNTFQTYLLNVCPHDQYRKVRPLICHVYYCTIPHLGFRPPDLPPLQFTSNHPASERSKYKQHQAFPILRTKYKPVYPASKWFQD